MQDDRPPSRAVGPGDIAAVRRAFRDVRDSDELLGIDHITGEADEVEATRATTRSVRRALVDEAIGFLDAREDLIDLQVLNGIDPSDLLDPWKD